MQLSYLQKWFMIIEETSSSVAVPYKTAIYNYNIFVTL